MTMHVDEALAAELAYRHERLVAAQRPSGQPRHRWFSRRRRQG